MLEGTGMPRCDPEMMMYELIPSCDNLRATAQISHRDDSQQCMAAWSYVVRNSTSHWVHGRESPRGKNRTTNADADASIAVRNLSDEIRGRPETVRIPCSYCLSKEACCVVAGKTVRMAKQSPFLLRGWSKGCAVLFASIGVTLLEDVVEVPSSCGGAASTLQIAAISSNRPVEKQASAGEQLSTLRALTLLPTLACEIAQSYWTHNEGLQGSLRALQSSLYPVVERSTNDALVVDSPS